MRPPRVLAVCVALFLISTARADSPLRLLPAESDAVVQIHDPKRAFDIVTNLDLLSKFYSLAAVQEQLDSTSARRFRQLVAYYEKSLGDKWPVLVAKLASKGAAVGIKFAEGDAPVVFVLQGDDEKLLEKFVAATVEIVEGELARQESKEKIQKGDYHGVPGFRLGNLWAARVGAALVLANKKEAMQKTLDLHLGRAKESMLGQAGLREAAEILPKNPLLSGWLNMVPIQKSPAGKDLYKTPRDNGQLTVLFGRYLDLLGRTPFVCAAVTADKDDFRLTVRAPRGTDGMGADRLLHLPPKGESASRPLLEPPGVIYSSTFYLDIASIWKDRDKLFPKVQADGITEFDKSSGRVLGGVKLSTILESAGPYHRMLAVNQTTRPYKREPHVKLPAFAFVTETRQPERFGRSMETLLRTGVLLATDTFKMELAEEKYRDHDLVAYRFNEKAEASADPSDIRFNFTPCFVRVGNQFAICSTVELGKLMVDTLLDEAKNPKPSRLSGRDRFYAKGLSDYLRTIDDTLVTQTILAQAVPPGEARKQVEELLKFVRGLGTAESLVEFGEKRFSFDVRVRLGGARPRP